MTQRKEKVQRNEETQQNKTRLLINKYTKQNKNDKRRGKIGNATQTYNQESEQTKKNWLIKIMKQN